MYCLAAGLFLPLEVSDQFYAPTALLPRVWPRAALDPLQKRKMSFPYKESNPNSSAHQTVARLYTA
jgi:hypothetical protein